MSKKQDKQALTASQLSTQLAALAGVFAPPSSGQGRYAAFLQDSGQGMSEAQADYMERKKQKEAAKKKGLGSMLGTGAALAAAPFTGGASLALAPAASQVGGGIASGNWGDVASGLASGAMGAKSAFAPAASTATGQIADMGGNGVYNMANQKKDPYDIWAQQYYGGY